MNLAIEATSALKNKSANNLEICRNIIIGAKENSNNIAVSNVIAQNGSHTATTLYGDDDCRYGRTCLRNLSLDNIYKFCTKFIGGNNLPQLKISWNIK